MPYRSLHFPRTVAAVVPAGNGFIVLSNQYPSGWFEPVVLRNRAGIVLKHRQILFRHHDTGQVFWFDTPVGQRAIHTGLAYQSPECRCTLIVFYLTIHLHDQTKPSLNTRPVNFIPCPQLRLTAFNYVYIINAGYCCFADSSA